VIVLMPPLGISMKDLRILVRVIGSGIDRATRIVS
jgi:hypothetical protein